MNIKEAALYMRSTFESTFIVNQYILLRHTHLMFAAHVYGCYHLLSYVWLSIEYFCNTE